MTKGSGIQQVGLPPVFCILLLVLVQTAGENTSASEASYGVDVSFPIQHRWPTSKRRYESMPVPPMSGRPERYTAFIKSCENANGFFNGFGCKVNEQQRIEMNLKQPSRMVNYTEIGYKKIRAPEPLFELIKTFWDDNKQNQTLESWGTANTYTNNWESPSYMVSVENSKLVGGGHVLRRNIIKGVGRVVSEWTGQELKESSMYGIRVYRENAILSPHVDRHPLISSAIINVAADVDEPWPLEVYGHDGKATNITMEPGDMVLYESHSVLHGRPFPLQGRFMANIFIHFEPEEHSAKMKDFEEKFKHQWVVETQEVTGVDIFLPESFVEFLRWILSWFNNNLPTWGTGFLSSSSEVYQEADLASAKSHVEAVGADL